MCLSASFWLVHSIRFAALLGIRSFKYFQFIACRSDQRGCISRPLLPPPARAHDNAINFPLSFITTIAAKRAIYRSFQKAPRSQAPSHESLHMHNAGTDPSAPGLSLAYHYTPTMKLIPIAFARNQLRFYLGSIDGTVSMHGSPMFPSVMMAGTEAEEQSCPSIASC